MSAIGNQVLQKLANIFGNGPTPLHAPIIGDIETVFVTNALKSSFVSSVGAYVNQFEDDIASFTGAKRAVAVVNGTSALQLALEVAGVKRGDEVLMPAMTFIATANAASHVGAIPHFIDVSETTLGVDPSSLAEWLNYILEPSTEGYRNRFTGRRVSAITPMHTFGHPCEIDKILEICLPRGIYVIEDAAEALGSFYFGRHLGTWGTAGIISFNGNKIITTGGGGVIITDSDDFADRVKHLSTTARLLHRWNYSHDCIGYNMRMPNLNAALGCAQMTKLDSILQSKRRLTEKYKHEFRSVPEFHMFDEPRNSRSNYWLQTLMIDSEYAHLRDSILQATNDAGRQTRPVWGLLNKQLPYMSCPSAPLDVSLSLEQRIINVPSSPLLP